MPEYYRRFQQQPKRHAYYAQAFMRKNFDELDVLKLDGNTAICVRKHGYVHRHKTSYKKKK